MKDRPCRTAIEKKAIETYGEAMQMVVCMEECAELMNYSDLIAKRNRDEEDCDYDDNYEDGDGE